MGNLDGKVAFITGAARGQGRSHALRLARDGADIIAIDVVKNLPTVPYDLATESDLEETARQVEALGRRIVTRVADVRDPDALTAALDESVAELGRLDMVLANAGIFTLGPADSMTPEIWTETIDVCLTGVWYTCKAAYPHLLKSGDGGSIVITSSMAAFKGLPMFAHYSAAKSGVVGLMRALAYEWAPDNIRVNTVHPGSVETDMVHNQAIYALFGPDIPLEERTKENLADRFGAQTALDIPWMEPIDVSNAIAWLVSDDARYVTGIQLPVDGGTLLK